MLVPVNRVAMFRCGDYEGKGSFTSDDLDAMAESYNPDYLMAPVTVDHRQEGPALGWIDRIYRENDLLMGDWSLHPDTVNLIKEGKYTRRSIEFYKRHKMPDGREVPYVKACSILGCAVPHAKGMPPIQFSESAGESTAIDFAENPTQQIAKGLTQMRTENPLTATAENRLIETLLQKGYFTSRIEAEKFTRTCKPAPGQTDISRHASFLHASAVAKRADELIAENPNLSYYEAAIQAQRELLSAA